ncbi:MAG: hypothetical protein JNK00_11020 [Flavipsychrobacter sp.]|nr:hypothetical protein [Flavipsychrobacter sp.]
MADTGKVKAASSKKDIQAAIAKKIEAALADMKTAIGDKKFVKSAKKAAKIFAAAMPKKTKAKKAPTAKKKTPAKRKAAVKKTIVKKAVAAK